MIKEYIDIIEEVLDDTVNELSEKSEEFVNEFFACYNIKYDEYYAYFLKKHGNDYIKEDYGYRYKGKTDDMKAGFYQFDILFGLQEGIGNIQKEIRNQEQMISNEYFPIAAMPGGDLVCMNKENGGIFFWFHEKNDNNMIFVADSFKELIMGIEKMERVDKKPKPIAFKIDSAMDELLKEAAKKYKRS